MSNRCHLDKTLENIHWSARPNPEIGIALLLQADGKKSGQGVSGRKRMSFSNASANGRNTKNGLLEHCDASRGVTGRVNLLLLHMASLGFGSRTLSRECQGLWLHAMKSSQVIYLLIFLSTVRSDLLHCHPALTPRLSPFPLQMA